MTQCSRVSSLGLYTTASPQVLRIEYEDAKYKAKQQLLSTRHYLLKNPAAFDRAWHRNSA